MIFGKINGLIVAPFAPFDKKGEVSLDPIDEYAKLLQRDGLIGVFINDSSGEDYMITVEKRMKTAEKWVPVALKGFKAMVYYGATCIEDSYKIAQHAQQIGTFDIGAVTSPSPETGKVEELVKYCEEIACKAPNLPFYFYYMPVLNGVYLPMLPFLKATDGRIPNLADTGYTYEPLYGYDQCMLHSNDRYDMLYDLDETIPNALVIGGARGGISDTGSYIGKVLVDIIDEYHKDNIAKAAELQNYAQNVVNVIAKYRGNVVCGKYIMKLLGLDLDINRAPSQNITDEEEVMIKKELGSIDFFSKCNK